MNSKKTKPIPKIYGYNKQMTKEDILQTAQQLKTVNNREGNPNLGNKARKDGIFVSFKFDQLIPNNAAGNFKGLTVLAKTKSPQKKIKERENVGVRILRKLAKTEQNTKKNKRG